MKLFRCTCKSKPVLYFENVKCESCGRTTGFCPSSLELKPITSVTENDDVPTADSATEGTATIWQDDAGRQFTQCANWTNHQVCNWLIPLAPDNKPPQLRQFTGNAEGLCPACRLNDIIPDLSEAANQQLWHRLEKAKRRCLFTLLELHLPTHLDPADERDGNPPALSFRFMSDKDADSHFQQPVTSEEPVLTGHSDGIITINLAEADDVARTQTRVLMQERYRTLLGHFRHETGHYYWDVFKALLPEFVQQCRAVFGDENSSYQEAVERHYEQGPPPNWQNNFVSAYATMHPWEDWAETWAHYLHIIDTLETQQSFSRNSEVLSDPVRGVSLPFAVGARGHTGTPDFAEIMKLWIEASIELNSLNRSMGLPDPYPFVLHAPIQEKLQFVHDTIQRYSEVANDAGPMNSAGSTGN